MMKTVEEALEKKRGNKNANPQKNLWFALDVRELAKEKRKTYTKYLNNRSSEEYEIYKNTRYQIKEEMRRIKDGYWETFISSFEHDLYGVRRKV